MEFMKIPNDLIDQVSDRKIAATQYILNVLVDIYRNMSYNGRSYVHQRTIRDSFGIAKSGDYRIMDDTIQALSALHKKGYIDFVDKLDGYRYNKFIRVQATENLLDCKDYTRLEYYELDTLMESDYNVKRENIVRVFLYLKRNFYHRDPFDTDSKVPNACIKCQKDIVWDTGLCRQTVIKCVNCLSGMNGDYPLIIVAKSRRIGKSIREQNIYVLNRPGYEHEIELAQDMLEEMSKKSEKE